MHADKVQRVLRVMGNQDIGQERREVKYSGESENKGDALAPKKEHCQKTCGGQEGEADFRKYPHPAAFGLDPVSLGADPIA
jgi:hypothetical protein